MFGNRPHIQLRERQFRASNVSLKPLRISIIHTRLRVSHSKQAAQGIKQQPVRRLLTICPCQGACSQPKWLHTPIGALTRNKAFVQWTRKQSSERRRVALHSPEAQSPLSDRHEVALTPWWPPSVCGETPALQWSSTITTENFSVVKLTNRSTRTRKPRTWFLCQCYFKVQAVKSQLFETDSQKKLWDWTGTRTSVGWERSSYNYEGVYDRFSDRRMKTLHSCRSCWLIYKCTHKSFQGILVQTRTAMNQHQYFTQREAKATV